MMVDNNEVLTYDDSWLPRLKIQMRLSRPITQKEEAALLECMKAFSAKGKDTAIDGVEVNYEFRYVSWQ